jgi:uncharacterized membrane-anchored protein
MTWLSDHWYFLTGIGGGLLVLTLYVYARRHPESVATSLWQRLYYTAASSAVVGSICMLITAMLFPNRIGVVLSPIAPFVLFALMWIAAPYIRQWLPLERSKS